MKHFIAFLLQYPVIVVLLLGLKVITGLGSLWCPLIAVILLLCFIKGYEMMMELTREVQIMKIFISYLLQYPVCAVLPAGIKLITGLSYWWCIPIAVIFLVSFIVGYEMTRRVQIMTKFYPDYYDKWSLVKYEYDGDHKVFEELYQGTERDCRQYAYVNYTDK